VSALLKNVVYSLHPVYDVEFVSGLLLELFPLLLYVIQGDSRSVVNINFNFNLLKKILATIIRPE
jgi:hypothetical protein